MNREVGFTGASQIFLMFYQSCSLTYTFIEFAIFSKSWTNNQARICEFIKQPNFIYTTESTVFNLIQIFFLIYAGSAVLAGYVDCDAMWLLLKYLFSIRFTKSVITSPMSFPGQVCLLLLIFLYFIWQQNLYILIYITFQDQCMNLLRKKIFMYTRKWGHFFFLSSYESVRNHLQK